MPVSVRAPRSHPETSNSWSSSRVGLLGRVVPCFLHNNKRAQQQQHTQRLSPHMHDTHMHTSQHYTCTRLHKTTPPRLREGKVSPLGIGDFRNSSRILCVCENFFFIFPCVLLTVCCGLTFVYCVCFSRKIGRVRRINKRTQQNKQ